MTTGRLAPIRSSIRPPIWAATTKPAKNSSRNSPASDAVLPSEIWAYSEAKKKMGTKANMAMPSTRFSTRKARTRKMRTCISGSSVRSSTRANTTRQTMPAAMDSPMAGLDHPQVDACWKPKTLRPTPATMSARPR